MSPVAACFAALLLATGAAAASAEVLKVWPGLPPGDEGFRPAPPAARPPPRKDDVQRLALVTEPTLSVFHPPAGTANGAAVIVCPGGGYNILAWNLEGTEVAAWLNSIGVTAAVLQYRVPRRDRDTPHAAPLKDAQRAIRHVRHNAAAWGIDPARIGILGFSAGGHLAVMAGTHWDQPSYARLDAVDDVSCRPDFLIPVYPAYLGNEDKAGPLSPLVRVTERTPPTFMVVTHDDKLRGINAALFYVELKKANVPAELHIFTRGGHGYGLRASENPVSRWSQQCADWLRAQGLLERTGPPGK